MSVQQVADDLLWISVPVWIWLTVVYLFLERGRGWLRVGLALTVVGVTQMVVRALLTDQFGEDYPGRTWVLLTGRLEIILAGIILTVALHRARWGTARSRRDARAAALEAISAPRSRSGDS